MAYKNKCIFSVLKDSSQKLKCSNSTMYSESPESFGSKIEILKQL